MAFTVASKRKAQTTAASTKDEDEFAGLWINVGLNTKDENGNVKHNRLPRGIAVSDLKDHRIYASTMEKNPEWAAEAQLVNAVIAKIREKGLTLEEGESVPLQLSVQLYRRQEQVDSVENEVEIDVDLDGLFDA
jgi:hypothetical protein